MKIINKVILCVGFVAVMVGSYFIFFKTPHKTNSNLIPVRVGYNTESVTNASIIIAYEKGYFQAHGLDPQMVPLKSGREVMLALAAGQVDLGIGSFTNFMTAMVKGVPIRIIAASASSPSFVLIRPNEGFNNLADFYGKNILVNASGINDLFFRSVMNRENIDVQKINFVDIERAYQVIALMDKRTVDAVVVSAQDTEKLLEAGAVVLPNWEEKGYDKEFLPRNSIVVNTEFLNQHEPETAAFLEALIDAHYLIHNTAPEAARLLSNHIKESSGGAVIRSPEEIVSQWDNKEVINMIWQDPSITMNLASKAKEIGAVDQEPTLQDIYDLRFMDKLVIAQKKIYGDQD
ncbi:MAG: ABC transporter substrate-binding protein [Patescibacteria group bacterium]|jgi:ABC-type nitrate/sulfonate/bicarbonate transport system substrate-binding protein